MNSTIVRLGLRSVLGRRRAILLVILPVLLLGVAVLVRAVAGESSSNTEGVMFGVGLSLVVPLVTLLAATAVAAPEIDDGSIVYLLAKPVSRHTIVISKLLVAVLCAVVFGAVAMLVAGLVMDPFGTATWLGYTVGAVVAAVTYGALFLMLSVVTRHAVVVGLLYLLIWEGLVGGLLEGVRWVSITTWSGAVVEAISDEATQSFDVGTVYPVVAALVVIVGATWFAGERLRSFKLSGEE